MGQNAQSSRGFIKTLWGCTRTLNCYRIIGNPGPKCFNPEFGELVFSLTLCDVADAMDAVYVVDAVDAVDAVEAVDAVDAVDAVEDVDAVDAVGAVDDVNVFTRFARFTSSRRISRLHVFTCSRASPQNLRTAAAINGISSLQNLLFTCFSYSSCQSGFFGVFLSSCAQSSLKYWYLSYIWPLARFLKVCFSLPF